VLRLRHNVQTLLRRRALEAVEQVLEEDLMGALGMARYQRGAGRQLVDRRAGSTADPSMIAFTTSAIEKCRSPSVAGSSPEKG
jgi:hypothetical protein